jgi:long-chain acyl-CoA synthetase
VLTLQPEIAQAMVYGDKRPYLVAVLVPEGEFVPPAAGSDDEKALLSSLNAALVNANEQLSNLEKVRRFIIADAAFTVDNQLLTPTLKIRRHKLRVAYADRLDRLYG